MWLFALFVAVPIVEIALTPPLRNTSFTSVPGLCRGRRHCL